LVSGPEIQTSDLAGYLYTEGCIGNSKLRKYLKLYIFQ